MSQRTELAKIVYINLTLLDGYTILDDNNTFYIKDITKNEIERSDSKIVKEYVYKTASETITKKFIVKATNEFQNEFNDSNFKSEISEAFHSIIKIPKPPNYDSEPNYYIYHQLKQYGIDIEGKHQENMHIASHNIYSVNDDKKLRLVFVYFFEEPYVKLILTNCGKHEIFDFQYGVKIQGLKEMKYSRYKGKTTPKLNNSQSR